MLGALGNVLLFAPLGAALGLRRLPRTYAVLLGIALAGMVEAIQLHVPGRTTSVDDVILNGLGVFVGHWLAGRRRLGNPPADSSPGGRIALHRSAQIPSQTASCESGELPQDEGRQSFRAFLRLTRDTSISWERTNVVVVTVGAQEGLLPHGLRDERVDRIQDAEPRAHAPHNNTQQQADASGQIGSLALGVANPSLLGRRVHDVTVLSVIALIQLSWLSVLGYGLFSVVR
jgi:VanZ like family